MPPHPSDEPVQPPDVGNTDERRFLESVLQPETPSEESPTSNLKTFTTEVPSDAGNSDGKNFPESVPQSSGVPPELETTVSAEP